MECWEFKKCPPEVRSNCPAYPNDGRNCWKVTGTMCEGGKISMASLSEKVMYCRQCDFYRDFAEKF